MSYHVGLNKTDFVKEAEAKLNSALDVSLIFHLLKKFKWVFIGLFLASALVAFLYLRYSQPIYEARVLLQINDNKTDQVLRLDGIGESENILAEAIEQIHSKVFLKRIVEKLDLGVCYFSEGTFKNYELYLSSPFLAQINLKNEALHGQKIYVELNEKLNAGVIRYGSTSRKFKINEWLKTTDFDINVYLNPKLTKAIIQRTIANNKAFYMLIGNVDQVTSELQGKIEVKVVNELAKTILLKVKDINQQKVSDVVNVVSEEFLSYDVERKSESSRSILSFIDKQLGLVYNDLRDTEKDLKQFKQDKNINNTNTQVITSDILRASNIEDQLMNVEMEEKLIDEVIKDINKTKNPDVYHLLSMISGTDYENMVKEVVQSIQKLLATKEDLLYSVTPNAENIKQINYQIENQKRLLIESLDAVKLRYKAKYKSLLEKSSDVKNKLGSASPEEDVELSRLNRLYSINEKYYTMLLEKKTEFSISKAGYVTKNIILEKAFGLGGKVFPSTKDTVMIAFVLTLLIILIILMIVYFTHNKIYSIHDVMKYSNQGVSLIGVVPKYDSQIPVSQLIVDKNPKSIISEAFRTIRTNLSFIDNTPGSKLISISSTVSGEGKTFIAINIAGILAFTGKRVVLIDLDMRKPKIHKGFGVKNDIGMSTILTGENTIDQCFNNSSLENLKFITAGPTPPNPSELILSDKLNQIIAELQTRFDYVVIDNAPVGLVTDGIETLRKSDYPIYVLRAEYSDKFFIQNLVRLKTENQITRLTAVLNDVDMSRKRYGYNYGYTYSYGYGTGYYTDDAESKKKKKK
jgi:tyrosine-protein kinase Etk/Wzc